MLLVGLIASALPRLPRRRSPPRSARPTLCGNQMRIASTTVAACLLACLALGCQRGKEQAVVIEPSAMHNGGTPSRPTPSARRAPRTRPCRRDQRRARIEVERGARRLCALARRANRRGRAGARLAQGASRRGRVTSTPWPTDGLRWSTTASRRADPGLGRGRGGRLRCRLERPRRAALGAGQRLLGTVCARLQHRGNPPGRMGAPMPTRARPIASQNRRLSRN